MRTEVDAHSITYSNPMFLHDTIREKAKQPISFLLAVFLCSQSWCSAGVQRAFKPLPSSADWLPKAVQHILGKPDPTISHTDEGWGEWALQKWSGWSEVDGLLVQPSLPFVSLEHTILCPLKTRLQPSLRSKVTKFFLNF